MNIKRAIMLVFTLRAAMLGAGCDGGAGYGEQCNDHDGACDFASRACKDGLYCPQAGGTCEYVNGDTADTPTPTSTSTNSNEPPTCTYYTSSACDAGEIGAHCTGDKQPSANFSCTLAPDVEPRGISYCCTLKPDCILLQCDADASDAGDDTSDAADE
jgi:hypothetical protein